MSVTNMTVGAVTPSGATFATKVTGGGPVRIAVADNAGMSDPVFFGPQSVNAQGVAKVSAIGLDPSTRYWWRVEDNGTIDTAVTGQFKTFPVAGSIASFTFASSTCAGLTPEFPGVGSVLASNRLSDHPVFDTIRERSLSDDWLFFSHLGDLHYYDIGSGVHVPDHTITTYRRAIDDVLLQPRQHALYRNVPWVWMWDDHDWGPDNSDSTHPGGPNAQQSYREKIPHYSLPHASGTYHSFQVGRVLFIVADTRSFRTPNSDPDGPSKTMLGADQKAWMESLLTHTGAKFLCWLLPSLWAGWTVDSFMVFENERNELIQMFGDTGWLKRMLIVSGDAHELGIDSGTRSPGAIPLYQFASLDARPAASHTRYDTARSSPGRNRYGTIAITDTGSRFVVAGTGWIGGNVWRTHTMATAPEPSAIIPATTSTIAGPHEQKVEARVLQTYQTSDDPHGVSIPVLGGHIRYDATADVFASLMLETEGHDGVDSLFPRHPSDLFSVYGNEIFVRKGIDLGEETLWFPMGMFRINDVEQADDSSQKLVITGQDRMCSIIDNELISPIQFRESWHLGSILRNLVRSVYPDVVISWDDDSIQQLLGRRMIVEESRFHAIRDIAVSLGKILYWDGIGSLQIQDPPDPDKITWNMKAGWKGVLTNAGRSVSREGVKNGWLVRGEGVSGSPVRAIAVDDGMNSPTRWGGTFGRVSGRHTSPIVVTHQQAYAAARNRLQRHLGRPYSINFGSVVNPLLRPWDVVRVTHKDGNRERHVIVSTTIPLVEGDMTGTTREQTLIQINELREEQADFEILLQAEMESQ